MIHIQCYINVAFNLYGIKVLFHVFTLKGFYVAPAVLRFLLSLH